MKLHARRPLLAVLCGHDHDVAAAVDEADVIDVVKVAPAESVAAAPGVGQPLGLQNPPGQRAGHQQCGHEGSAPSGTYPHAAENKQKRKCQRWRLSKVPGMPHLMRSWKLSNLRKMNSVRCGSDREVISVASADSYSYSSVSSMFYPHETVTVALLVCSIFFLRY